METHVCPWYIGYLLASPLRRLVHSPEKILSPYIREGMRVLEVGPGMGFFTIPMARSVGAKGRIFTVDLQEPMIRGVRKRAVRAGVAERIEARLCSDTSLKIDDLSDSIDFALLFAVVHEVPDQTTLFSEIHHAMKKGGLVLVAEPTGHVSDEAYAAMLSMTSRLGFRVVETPVIKKSLASVLKRE